MKIISKETGLIYEVLDFDGEEFLINNGGYEQWWEASRFKMYVKPKKIEKIENLEFRNLNEYEKLQIRNLKDTINELIDAINELKKGE